MGILKETDKNIFDLDNYYFINEVSLKESEALHTHNFIEFVYTSNGRGMHTIDGREYHVKAGDLLIVNYGQKHSVIPTENLVYTDIMLKPEYVNSTLKGTEDVFLLLQLRDFSDLSNRIIKDNIHLHFDGDEKDKIEFLLSWTMQEQKNPTAAADLIIYSALSMLLSLVFRKMTQNQNTRLAINDHLLLYIERNCKNKLIIGDMASKCGYTAEHFSRLFKRYTGKTPVEFVNNCRINLAKKLLTGTDKPVENIISECGFSNRAAFFKKFYNATGTTPLAYRKNQK